MMHYINKKFTLQDKDLSKYSPKNKFKHIEIK